MNWTSALFLALTALGAGSDAPGLLRKKLESGRGVIFAIAIEGGLVCSTREKGGKARWVKVVKLWAGSGNKFDDNWFAENGSEMASSRLIDLWVRIDDGAS